MKIPFNIKFRPQIESGEYKVQTRDGRTVRIICWDRVAKENTDADLNICVLVPEDNGEAVYYYYQSGQKWVSDERFDLFIITPEPEMTEFEKIISGCLQKHGLLDCGAADKIAKECSTELLDLARKEIMDGWSHGLRDTQDFSGKAYDDGYQLGLEQGKAEVLKDLPRWQKCDWTIPKIGAHVDNEGRLIFCGHYVPLVKLTEKLPGFKEI